MSHFIDYHVGAELFVPPLMQGGEGCIVIVSKVEDDFVHLESSTLLVDKKTNRTTSGYKQILYSSKEQYEQVTKEHLDFLKNMRIMDNIDWLSLSSEQVFELVLIACPDANTLKPEPFYWHELTGVQLAQMVAVVSPIETT